MKSVGVNLYFAGKPVAKIPGSYPKPRRAFHFYQRSLPMSDLKAAFDKAMADSKNLSERPDNATLLKIYALYKQGSTGDNTDKKPGFSEMVERAKWDAWNGVKGISCEDAMQQYIDLIDTLS